MCVYTATTILRSEYVKYIIATGLFLYGSLHHFRSFCILVCIHVCWCIIDSIVSVQYLLIVWDVKTGGARWHDKFTIESIKQVAIEFVDVIVQLIVC